MKHITQKFMGYKIDELLKEYLPLKCPSCKRNRWRLYVTKNGKNLVALCLNCGHIPSLQEILGITHLKKDSGEK